MQWLKMVGEGQQADKIKVQVRRVSGQWCVCAIAVSLRPAASPPPLEDPVGGSRLGIDEAIRQPDQAIEVGGR